MPDSAVLFRRLALAAIALTFTLHAPAALAQSKRDRAAAEGLVERMAAAEVRYRESLVRAANNDPEAISEGNAALEDMEDVMIACEKQRGCNVSRLLPGWKRLLKAQADDVAGVEGEEPEAWAEGEGELPTGDVPDAASAAALLSEDGQRFVRMVQFNPAVQAGIRRWLTDMRVALVTSHENYQYMRHMMSPAFERRGLPEALLFGIMAKESNGRVHAGSRAGAVGPLQFMPATGQRFGLGPDGTGFDTRYDPRMSSDAAASYLSERFAEFGNDVEMWLAAYNGGEGRASRVHRGSGGRKFWDADVYNQFPAETRDYVPMVIAAAWLYLHPREYGLSFPKVDARPATFALASPASIYELTICMGDSGSRHGYLRSLRNLNPRYEADTVIAGGTLLNGTVRMAGLYKRWCAQGKRADLARQLMGSSVDAAIVRTGPIEVVRPGDTGSEAAGSVLPATTPVAAPQRRAREHRVARGETLAAVSRRYGCDVRGLARANGVKAPAYAIRVGQQLKLEGCKG
ncbi:transglycosylase SLT domain-containing protein [Luteimonas sp. MC1572]|uniref:transglycosylase SLT domain-containing protein n=1 Tax=Luteimonas sp. MC1572 TaxID=2799325 RepID=UPI0018F1068C|nr:transglycosylase SLT domain-containing protein [Luteimonas sp. MC1572]MBJ6982929.1 transglycosylase SLT domain-containing protein [Luteimonas sp. MC1572]QQO04149.1 transglycosylase SLT domain-containing protein [Luteimonas sp. MC1572]